MRFLFTVWNFAGCLHPAIAIGKELRSRGHTVGFYTGSAFRDSVEREGFLFFPFQEPLERIVQEKVYSANSVGANWNRPWKIPSLLKQFFVDSMPFQLEDVEAILAAWKPDAIGCDSSLFAPYLIIYEKLRIPVALLSYPLGCQLPGPEIPPVGFGLPLPRNVFTRVRNQAAGKVLDFFLSDFRRGVNEVREYNGLRPISGPVIGSAVNLPLYIVVSCRELDYPRPTLPPNVYYVGPCVSYPPNRTPPRIEELQEDLPCVYVNEGTIHADDPYILRAAKEALADLPVRVVMTTGLHRDAKKLGLEPLPPNIILEPWVNHDVLMPRINAMVCSGSSGTVLAALRCGVPMVVVSTEWDHPENAQRVVEAGVGIRIAPRQCTAKNLRKAVRRLLEEPQFRLNAQRMSVALSKYGGAPHAASLLEGLGANTAAQESAVP
jgi:UDP:flavonoid glycosyltransferase YjiC (YdhE family)